ncbi:MAG: endo-1,4-beta-xylanase [Oscillospiraceae bacterium]|nr:endo-1,4-beta-xylanase [Oscillospiraceae bacterium]
MSEFSLAGAYKPYFDIGAAVSPRTIVSHADLLKQHFNSLTCENQMKYIIVHPEENRYDFSEADQIVAFAKENGMRMRAHAPVWHAQTPDWIFKAGDRPAPRELIYERLEQHIKTVAEHFGDAVYCYDVVNEATTDTVDPRHLARFGNETYRQTRYLTACGVEYLEKAYFFMRKYAPHAQLFYNDYNECDPLKRERIYTLMKNLLDRGAPLHGFGLQTHYNIYGPEMDEVKKSIECYASLGLRLHITEMDISFYQNMADPQIEPTQEQIEKQAKIYEDLFALYRSYSDVIDSVTFWGVADDRTWLSHPNRLNWPLPFDRDHNPKPFVAKLIEAAK